MSIDALGDLPVSPYWTDFLILRSFAAGWRGIAVILRIFAAGWRRGKGDAGEELDQFRRTEVRRNGGQRIRPGLFGAQADTARHPSGLPRVSIGKKEFIRLRWVSRPTLVGKTIGIEWKVLDPVGQIVDPVGQVVDPVGQVVDPAGQVVDPAG